MDAHPPRHRTTRRLLRRTALVAASALVLGFGVSATSADAKPNRGPGVRSADPGVMANLFEWNWKSVAKECTDVLGPAGYGGVQVAPPQDSVKRTSLGDGSDTVLHPWWEVYQATDYALTSRMGNEADFKKMVRICRSSGVKVYVDAVLNHMTGQGDTSYGGITFERYRYPGVKGQGTYVPGDFHKYSGDCPSSSGGIEDFNNKRQVFNCELVGLADLRTDTATVQNELADYLNKLIGYGVSGFRVDAAKHIGQDDLDAIHAKLNRTREGTKPYWALEVFGGGPGILSPQAFTRSGTVLGLDGVKQIRDAFKSYPDEHVGSIATLEAFGAESGLTPSAKTLSFVQNHDTERNGDALNYTDGARNILATQWLLASGYGTPQVYAGFTFDTRDDSPPADSDGMITDTDCAKGWACTDRNAGVKAMVSFHNFVRDTPRQNFYTDDANVIAFSRGRRGWAAFNNGSADKTITVQTGLRRGTYCDLVNGRRSGFSCTGPSVTVGADGLATVTVKSRDAVAIVANVRTARAATS